MHGVIHQFFTEDHHRIEALLQKAIAKEDEIDIEAYLQFRPMLLKHIKMEEKVLFPAALQAEPELMKELLPQFRLEHGALTALVVPPPTHSLIKVIMNLLEKHDFEEEKSNGLYDVCERLTKDKREELLLELKNTTEVPVHPPNPAPIALEAAKRALQRAGYDYDELLQA